MIFVISLSSWLLKEQVRERCGNESMTQTDEKWKKEKGVKTTLLLKTTQNGNLSSYFLNNIYENKHEVYNLWDEENKNHDHSTLIALLPLVI